MAIDKDILYKGNKIYCPEKCIFVPFSINSLFTKRQNRRGDYPIGVCKNNEGQSAVFIRILQAFVSNVGQRY